MTPKNTHDAYKARIKGLWTWNFPQLPCVQTNTVMGVDQGYIQIVTTFHIEKYYTRAGAGTASIVLETNTTGLLLYYERFDTLWVPHAPLENAITLPQNQEDDKTITLFLNHVCSEYLK